MTPGSQGGATVKLEDGTVVTASRGVVVATTGPEAGRLLGEKIDAAPSKVDSPAVGTACLYFRQSSLPHLPLTLHGPLLQ